MSADRLSHRPPSQTAITTTTASRLSVECIVLVVVVMLALFVSAVMSTDPSRTTAVDPDDAVSSWRNSSNSSSAASVDDNDEIHPIRHHRHRHHYDQQHQQQQQQSTGGRSRTVRSGARYDNGRSLGPLASPGGGVYDAYEASVRRLPVETMMSRMGDDFDARWMSVERPAANQSSPAAQSDIVSADDPELMSDLRRLRFTYRDERGDEHQLRPAVVRQLERWLLDRARCEVRYSWTDMGVSFWPRWIRHGACDTRVACSWPPGMHCAPAESDTLRLLHWQCRRISGGRHRRMSADGSEASSSSSTGGTRGGSRTVGSRSSRRRMRSDRTQPQQQQQCRWKKVPYPVTSECFCSC